MRRYVAKSGAGQWGVKDGDTIELELAATDEADLVDGGRLELVPREYSVVGDHEVHDTRKGDTFKAALSAGQEAALFKGGHIKLVPDEPKKQPKGGKS